MPKPLTAKFIEVKLADNFLGGGTGGMLEGEVSGWSYCPCLVMVLLIFCNAWLNCVLALIYFTEIFSSIQMALIFKG